MSWPGILGWSKTPAPDGSLSAVESFEADTGSNVFNRIYLLSQPMVSCFSIFIKAPEHRYAFLRNRSNNSYTHFDLQAVSVTKVDDPGTTPAIVELGDGWFRLSAAWSADGGSSQTIMVGVSDSLNGTQALGQGRSFVAWGPQLEDADFPTPYVAPGYSPRIEWGPDGKRKGLLIEGSSTNLLAESEFHNGKPANGHTSSVTAVSSFPGLTRGTGLHMAHDPNNAQWAYATGLTFTPNTEYTFSAFVVMDDGSAPEISSASKDFNVVVAGIGGTTKGVEHIAGDLYRVWGTSNVGSSPGGSAGLFKAAADSTKGFKFSGYQLETKPYATSYIPTTTAQVTRAADVAKIEGEAFKSWYNQGEGTVYVEVSSFSPEGFKAVLNINDGTLTNRLADLSIGAGPSGGVGTFRLDVFKNNTNQAFLGSSRPFTLGTREKAAFGFKENDFAFCHNGAAPTLDSSGTPPIVDRMELGNRLGALQLNGYIKDFRFFPKRLSNEALVALTS
tara:strand:+ start:1423 stop:2928 length:1506 start_codon:yes stop_codon:yes gene_type:complete